MKSRIWREGGHFYIQGKDLSPTEAQERMSIHLHALGITDERDTSIRSQVGDLGYPIYRTRNTIPVRREYGQWAWIPQDGEVVIIRDIDGSPFSNSSGHPYFVGQPVEVLYVTRSSNIQSSYLDVRAIGTTSSYLVYMGEFRPATDADQGIIEQFQSLQQGRDRNRGILPDTPVTIESNISRHGLALGRATFLSMAPSGFTPGSAVIRQGDLTRVVDPRDFTRRWDDEEDLF